MTAIIKDILIEARAKIADPARWTKGSFARHANGNPIGPREANAVCWCLQGAIRVIPATPKIRGSVHEVLQTHLPAGFTETHHFNDHAETTHADVLALFDRAIASVPS